MNLTCIIIDDEESARLTLQALLSNYCPNVEILAMANDVASGLEAIQQHAPDLVFLDVQMPRENGFMLLEKTKERKFQVVFTSAYDSYALRAIKVSALDYLLKPIDILELQNAVAKAIEVSKNDNYPSENIEVMSENLKQPNPLSRRIVLQVSDGHILTRFQDIIRCEGDRNYSRIHLKDGRKLVVSKTLKTFEELLPENIFLRIHKSNIINLHEVVKFSRGAPGTVEMCDGTVIDISRGRKEEFLDRLRGLNNI